MNSIPNVEASELISRVSDKHQDAENEKKDI